MLVSGLVVSAADAESARCVSERLAGDEAFTFGEWIGLRLAVSVAAPDGPASERLHDRLLHLPGVVKVDVAFVYADTPEEIAREC